MKKDMFDNRYDYYFYGVNNDDIDNDFECIRIPGSCLQSNMKRSFMDYDDNKWIKELELYVRENNYSRVFIIKIPSYYMGWVHRNGVKESFVPILKSYDNDKNIFLISELIYASYDVVNGDFQYNEKYNAIIDPNGLQYSDEQITKMYKYGCYDLYKKAFDRRKYDYDKLRMMDINVGVWEKTLRYYKASRIKKLILNINKNHGGRR